MSAWHLVAAAAFFVAGARHMTKRWFDVAAALVEGFEEAASS